MFHMLVAYKDMLRWQVQADMAIAPMLSHISYATVYRMQCSINCLQHGLAYLDLA
jgi:hypothetical protein